MNYRSVEKVLLANGWEWLKRKNGGSHRQFRHISTGRMVTVPYHRNGICIGTLKSIERSTGLRFAS